MGFFRYIIFIVSSLYVVVIPLNAQNYSPNNKKAKKFYNKGIEKYRKGDFTAAIDYFQKTIDKEPDFVPAFYQLASIFYKRKNFEKSEQYYKKSLQIDSSFNNQVYYSLGVVLEKQNKLQEALGFYKKFLVISNKKGDLEKKSLLKIKNLPFRIYALSHPVSYSPQPVSSNINTENGEYLPLLTGDNSKMIFTRRIGNQEDFYVSVKKNGKWQKAKPLERLNTPANEGAQSITPDGKTIYYTVCDRRRTYGSCDLVFSRKINGKWTKPHNLGKTINSVFWDSQPSISPDGKTLYFASNRPGGIGGKDIWYSVMDSLGNWTKPVCLDTMINTKFDDKTPYIHPDNRTLYFTSSGHTGMGGLDLFMSKKVKGRWTKAKNLGYPVNTANDEGALFVTLDGKTAYFSTDRKGKGKKNLDIYYFDMDKQLQPDRVTYVKGIVYSKDNKKKLDAVLQLFNNDTGEKIMEIKSDKDSFLVTLPGGVDYNFTVDKAGYVFYSGRFELKKANTILNPYYLDVELVKIDTSGRKKSQPFVLKNVFFDYDSAVLDTVSSKIELNNLIRLLKQNPQIKIKVTGHTDNIGSDSYNLELSRKRAKAVCDYLISKNIRKDRLYYEGFGKSKPVAPNDTEKGRRLNRRTEFEIIYR